MTQCVHYTVQAQCVCITPRAVIFGQPKRGISDRLALGCIQVVTHALTRNTKPGKSSPPRAGAKDCHANDGSNATNELSPPGFRADHRRVNSFGFQIKTPPNPNLSTREWEREQFSKASGGGMVSPSVWGGGYSMNSVWKPKSKVLIRHTRPDHTPDPKPVFVWSYP